MIEIFVKGKNLVCPQRHKANRWNAVQAIVKAVDHSFSLVTHFCMTSFVISKLPGLTRAIHFQIKIDSFH